MRECEAPGCDRPARTSGTRWCERCRQRVAKYGTPSETPRARAQRLCREMLQRVATPEAFRPGACWEWPGARNAKGYGRTNTSDNVGILAHRLTWTLTNGPIPIGMAVCHRCDNPPCVRPSHLFLGTAADNAADMVAKGRSAQPRNERSGMAKLTNEQVTIIRQRRESGDLCRVIAADFGVHQAHVSRITRGLRRPPDANPAEATRDGWMRHTWEDA